jgi:hypothetical protein
LRLRDGTGRKGALYRPGQIRRAKIANHCPFALLFVILTAHCAWPSGWGYTPPGVRDRAFSLGFAGGRVIPACQGGGSRPQVVSRYRDANHHPRWQNVNSCHQLDLGFAEGSKTRTDGAGSTPLDPQTNRNRGNLAANRPLPDSRETPTRAVARRTAGDRLFRFRALQVDRSQGIRCVLARCQAMRASQVTNPADAERPPCSPATDTPLRTHPARFVSPVVRNRDVSGTAPGLAIVAP